MYPKVRTFLPLRGKVTLEVSHGNQLAEFQRLFHIILESGRDYKCKHFGFTTNTVLFYFEVKRVLDYT